MLRKRPKEEPQEAVGNRCVEPISPGCSSRTYASKSARSAALTTRIDNFLTQQSASLAVFQVVNGCAAHSTRLLPPLGPQVMRLIRFGKGQRLPNVAAHSLTQGVVPPFHMRSLPSFLPNTMMGFSRKHVLVGMPKITEGVAALVFIWNALPQTEAGGLASVAKGEPHDLARSAAHRRPYPSLVIFFAHKTPDAHPIRERHPVSQAEGFL